MGNIFAWIFIFVLSSPLLLARIVLYFYRMHIHGTGTSRRRGDSVSALEVYMQRLRTERKRSTQSDENHRRFDWKEFFGFVFSSFFFIIEFMRSGEVMPSKCVQMMRYDRGDGDDEHTETHANDWKWQNKRIVSWKSMGLRLVSRLPTYYVPLSFPFAISVVVVRCTSTLDPFHQIFNPYVVASPPKTMRQCMMPMLIM